MVNEMIRPRDAAAQFPQAWRATQERLDFMLDDGLEVVPLYCFVFDGVLHTVVELPRELARFGTHGRIDIPITALH